MHRSSLVIVTPALANANNGNWQTAHRWASLLRPAYRVHLSTEWQGGEEALMIALHAQRSAASIAAWRSSRAPAAQRPLVVVLTGTDLYRDIATDAQARQSLALAAALAAQHPRFRWLGGLPHASVRRRIQAAHVLVHASRMEGGAHVVIEALRSGTPVLASRIDGNVGLLGEDHEGLFDVGDDAALAALLARAQDEPAMLERLAAQGALRAPLFAPAAEQAALHRLLGPLISRTTEEPSP